MNKTDLQAIHDTRDSFYGKAYVKEDSGTKTLYSYNTKVAEITGDNNPVVFGIHSKTTLRHIKEFLKQSGFKADTHKQLWEDYGVEK